MSNEPITETEKLKNEIALLTIERDRYHDALYKGHESLGALGQAIDAGQLIASVEIYAISGTLWNEWKFRQHGCPKCGLPCKFFFAMSFAGPHIRSWDCPKCGSVGDSEKADQLKAWADDMLAAREAKGIEVTETP